MYLKLFTIDITT